MSPRQRVRQVLTSHLTIAILLGLASCSKSEAAPTRKTPARFAATGVAQVRAPDVPATWPATATLTPILAEQLLARVRSREKKGTLVNAWASWCGPCRAELPMLASLAKNLAVQSIEVVLVSVDEPADREKAKAFLQSLQIALPVYLAAPPLERFKVGLNPRWPGMLPATFLFDRAGKLRYFWGGEAYESEIVNVVDSFLAGTLVETEADFSLAPGTTTR